MALDLDQLLVGVRAGEWDLALGDDASRQLREAGPEELTAAWPGASGPMVQFTGALSGPLFRLRCVAEWKGVMEAVSLDAGATVVEVASGASDPVPAAAAMHLGSEGEYVSANLNARLTEGLRRATARLPLPCRVVEDDAANLDRYLQPESVDLFAFHHAIKDVVQTIAFGIEGRDTAAVDWFHVLPDMVRMVAEYWSDGRMESRVRPEYLRLVAVCAGLLKPGGVMAFTHHMYQGDIDLGYPMDLYSAYVPIARRWMHGSNLPLEEISLAGYDPDWWLFLRKADGRGAG